MAARKSKILVIGGTGYGPLFCLGPYIGKYIVEASAKGGEPTFALVRQQTLSKPAKATVIDKFKNLGVTLLQGNLYDHESLVNTIKQVDVVISIVGFLQLADQVNIIAAIKEAGNIKLVFYGLPAKSRSVAAPRSSANWEEPNPGSETRKIGRRQVWDKQWHHWCAW